MTRRQQAMSYRAEGNSVINHVINTDNQRIQFLIAHILVDLQKSASVTSIPTIILNAYMRVEEETVGSPRVWLDTLIQIVIPWYLG